MKKQIIELKDRGCSLRKIAKSLHVSRETVRRVLREAGMLAGKAGRPAVADRDWKALVPWPEVSRLYGEKGVSIQQLHREYAPERPYVSFWRAFREHQPKTPESTIRQTHKPGEKTQLDYTDGLWVVDRATGQRRKTQLFVGTLPFSSYTYGEFGWDQKQPSFIGAQDRMWSFFGGVTPYVVIDNLKSGVTQADLYDPDANPTYVEYGNHMGFAVLPARPYHPKDKGKVESQIGVIQRGFYQEVRERSFYSLDELNRCFWQYLKRLNAKVMKDYGVSRQDRFKTEKQTLLPLPKRRFEVSQWKTAKVHPDCHIQVERNFYSVPHIHIGQLVRVRLTQTMVEVFSEADEALAVHARLKDKGRYATVESHYLEAKLAQVRFDVVRAKQEAQKVGPQTHALVEQLLSGSHPLRFLRRTQGILRLSRQYSHEAMEYACGQALQSRKLVTSYVKACCDYHDHGQKKPRLAAPSRQRDTVHLHGSDAGGQA